MKTSLPILLFFFLVCGFAKAQLPQVGNCSLPPGYFVNEEFCFNLDLVEANNTGFGPYLRIILPPGMELHAATFGNGATLTLVDTSDGSPMHDPFQNTGQLSDSVSLPAGSTFWIFQYPVGSVTAGGVALTTTLCVLMDPAIVTIGMPLDVQLQGGYIYGNTPTGSNGPTLGPLMTAQVIPMLYAYKKSSGPLPRHDRTPGPDWPLTYTLNLDIANAQSVTGIVFTDILPHELMFIPGSIITPPGCLINSSGITPGVPGGSFTVTCPSAIGTLASSDALVTYSGYAIDILDESAATPCDEFDLVNLSNVATNQGPVVVSNDTVQIYNLTFQQVAAPNLVVPGTVITNTIHVQVSDYIMGMDSLRMSIRVEDGMDFMGNCTLDALPITPNSITLNAPSLGQTMVIFDLAASRGGIIPAGDSLILTYDCLVRQNYQATGAQVLARDILTTFSDGHYHLLDELPGTVGCDYSYKAPVVVIQNTISKQVVGGTSYVPGQTITYLLQMILPSGDANNVVFTDFLPIPIHNVANMNLTWGGPNVSPGPNHYPGAPTPTISTLPANNGLVINFGNVSSFNSPETLQVYITVPVTTTPFANGLVHSNFLQVTSDNTPLSTLTNLQLTQITIGAPMLSIVKGISAITSPYAGLTLPGSFPVNSNGFNVDAHDTVTFVSTIANIGGAQAFNVMAVDPMPMQFSGCQIISVNNAVGNPYPYHGTLFSTLTDTLVIDSMAASGPDSIVFITYNCVIDTPAVSYDAFTNTMSVAWASAMGQDSLFDVIQDSAFVRMRSPYCTKALTSITPGHAGNIGLAHVGEVIGYVATITFPETLTDSLRLRDIMAPGLAFAGVDSIVVSPYLSSSIGPLDSVVPVVDSVFSGLANHDRSVSFYFGNIHNLDNNNATNECIRIYYKARVLNTTPNVRGAAINNYIVMTWRMRSTGQLQSSDAIAPTVHIVEPTLSLTKEFLTPYSTPGDSVWVSLRLEHTAASNANAYDVTVTDTLPFGLNFIANSFSGACPSTFSVMPTYGGGVVSATWDSLALGTTCEIRFKVAVDNAFPGCNDIVNHGNLTWESIYHSLQPALANCPSNPYGVERTGMATSPGQLNNYAAQGIDTLHIGIAFAGIPQITGNAPICIGNQLMLSCTPIVGNGVQYIWTTPQGQDTTTLPQLLIYPTTAADSGYYAVTVSVGGCLSPSSIQYLGAVVPTPLVLVAGDALLCAGVDHALTAVPSPAGSYSFVWNGPNGFISSAQNPLLTQVTPAMSGAYTVQISGNGCTSAWSAPVNIQVLNRPLVTTVHDTLTCSYGLVDLVLHAYPQSGTAPYTFFWTGPGGYASTMQHAIIPNAMAANQGNYIVTMTDSSGCASLPITAVVDITDAPQTPVITQQGALCPGDALTLVTTPYAGGAVTYYWVTPNGPVNTTVPSLNFPSVTTNHAGLYAVVVEIDGCQTLMSALSTVVVNAAPSAPQPAANYGNPSNCAGDTLWLSAQGDTTHTYLWSGPNGFTANGPIVFVPNADPAANGSYQVTVSNATCSTVASVTINSILPYPATPSLLQPNVVCEGDPVIMQANAYNGTVVNYLWNTPTGLHTTPTPSLLLQPVTMADSGNYAMMVNVNGCNSLQSGTVELIVYPKPAMPAIWVNSDTLCEGDTLLLATANVPGAAYHWSGPAGYFSTQQNPSPIIGVTTIHTGVFELYIDWQGCRSAIARDTIAVFARPASPTLYTPMPALCQGEPLVLSSNGTCSNNLWVSPLGLSNGTWNNPSQNTSTASTVIAATDSAYIAGDWTAICVAANGCYSLPSAPLHIDITPLPAAPSITNPGPVCAGMPITLSASSAVVGGNYQWLGPNAFAYNGHAPTIYNTSLAQAGNYGAVVWDFGCASDTAWTTVVIDTTPATPAPTAAGPACAGGTLNLLANTTAASYLWTGPNGFTSTLSNPSISNANASNSGFYNLTVVQNACSSAVGSTNILVVNNTMVPSLFTSGPICEGEDIQLTGTPSSAPNASYIWNCPNATTDTTTVPMLTEPMATMAAAGWYSLSIIVEGCASPLSAPQFVYVHPRPATPSIMSNGPVCADGNIVLATTALADSYLWTGPNSFVSTQQQPTVITHALAYHAGNYHLQVTTDGCASADTSVMVQVNVPGAAPTLQSNSPVCLGDTITISASAGADSYVWTFPNGSTSTTTGSIVQLAPATAQYAGQFTVAGMYGGCPTAASAAITVAVGNDAQEHAYAGPDQLVCNDGTQATLMAGNATVSGLWTTSSNAIIVSPGHVSTLVTNLQVGVDYVFYWTIAGTGCRANSADSMHLKLAQSPLANPNAFALKDEVELLNAAILFNDSTWLEEVNLRVVGDPQHGICALNPNHTLNYVPDQGFVGNDSLLYEICLKACPEMCDMARVQLEVNALLTVPDLITPNGDGINDAFEMIGLEHYPHNQILIFNRWGNEVFSQQPYQNDWKGTYNNAPLPDGTYFWILEDTDNGGEIMRGYLTVQH